MPTTFIQLYRELSAQVQSLDPFAAQKYVHRAWKDIRQKRDWSFLIARGVLSAPAQITAGTVSINQFSRDLTFDASATMILDALTLDIPLTSRQIRIAGGPYYNFATYTPGGTATLDPLGPAFQEAPAVAASFSIVKCYYAPPLADFARFISIMDVTNKRPILHGAKYTQEYLDAIDPTRTDTTTPRILAKRYGQETITDATIPISASNSHTNYSPRWEMWPCPTAAQGFPCIFRKLGQDFLDADGSALDNEILPDIISEETVMARAKYLAYEWAEANKSTDPKLAATNWIQLKRDIKAEYELSLADDIRIDRERFPDSVIPRLLPIGYDYSYSLDHADPFAFSEAILGYL